MKEELKKAGWTPDALHPGARAWKEPGRYGKWFPGPFYAWSIMKSRSEINNPINEQL